MYLTVQHYVFDVDVRIQESFPTLPRSYHSLTIVEDTHTKILTKSGVKPWPNYRDQCIVLHSHPLLKADYMLFDYL